MRALLRNVMVVMVGAGIACASVALAAPKPAGPKAAASGAAKASAPKGTAPKGASPKGRPPAAPKVSAEEQIKLARQHYLSRKYDEALTAIDAGLAVAPKDDPLLELKGEVLLRMNDEPRALDAYKALDKELPPGAKKREVQKIIANLTIKLTTFVEVTVTNGPARVQFGPKRRDVWCEADPSCTKAQAPGVLNVTVERPGFDPWTGRVTVASGATEKLTVTLTESSSKLTMRVAQPGASVTVDGAAYDPLTPLKPGKHEVVVSLDRHETARLEAVASLGKPIELDVTLARIVPVRIDPAVGVLPPSTELLLDGKRVSIQDGTLRVQPGAHDLVVKAPGFQPHEIKIPAEPGPDYQAVVALQRIAEPGGLTFRRKLALAAGGIGLAALGTGAVLGLQSGQLETKANTLCPEPAVPCRDAPEANDLNPRARSRALQANIAFGAAGAAAIAATVLWLTGSSGSPGPRESREPRMAVTPRLDGAAAGLDLAVRF
jgi:hypothetical protein